MASYRSWFLTHLVKNCDSTSPKPKYPPVYPQRKDKPKIVTHAKRHSAPESSVRKDSFADSDVLRFGVSDAITSDDVIGDEVEGIGTDEPPSKIFYHKVRGCSGLSHVGRETQRCLSLDAPTDFSSSDEFCFEIFSVKRGKSVSSDGKDDEGFLSGSLSPDLILSQNPSKMDVFSQEVGMKAHSEKSQSLGNATSEKSTGFKNATSEQSTCSKNATSEEITDSTQFSQNSDDWSILFCGGNTSPNEGTKNGGDEEIEFSISEKLKKTLTSRESFKAARVIAYSVQNKPVDGSKENISPSEKKMGGRSQPNPPSMTYTVSANDTLTSVAARFDTTPSELTKLNRLNTRFLFPGQVLAVPDKSAINDEKTAPVNAQEESNGQDLLANIRPVTPTQRGDTKIPLSPPNYPRTPANSVDVDRSLDQDCLEKFLKISVRHITDGQGVVAGVLLVTPNAVMFDPNVSDPLVIEHGPESYGVIAPMEYVVNAALFYDIAHMKVKDTNLPKPEIPKPEIYWGPSQDRPESPGKDASLCKDATFPELAASQDDNDSSCSCGGDTRESSAFPKAFEHELLSPIGSDASPASGEGQPSPVQPLSSIQHQVSAPSAGDLTPIAEAGRLEDTQATPPNLAQTQCDNTAAQELAQNDSTSAASQIAEDVTCNDKKRTTSVTFDLTGDEESIPDLGGEASMQESRKQKVLKRLSYPLSWMESFNTDKENMPQNQPLPPSSAPPSGGMMTSMPDGTDANKAGMFSNVFNMSNVSNMLSSSPKYLVDFSSGLFARSPSDSTSSLRDVSELDTPPGSFDGYRLGQSVFYRKQSSLSSEKEERKGIPIFQPGRPSLDFARRPGNQQPLFVSSQQTPPSSLTQQTSPQVISHPAGAPITPNQQAHKRAQYKDGPKFGLKSMVSMDDMPELFASFDILAPHFPSLHELDLGFKEDSLKELIPKPAASCEDPPLYLCLKMGKPAGKSIPKSTPVMSYGKKRMRPEYWFSIPRNRSDELYNFFQRWAQAIYGELNEDDIAAKGFVLIEEDTDIWDDDVQGKGEGGDNIGGELTEMTKESWEKIKAPYVKLYSLMKSQMTISTESENPEVVSMSEELRRALYSSSSLTSLDLEVFLPEVVGTTDIVTDHVRKSMYKKLPVRCQGYAWKLVFSTAQHGFSLNSLYRKMTDVDSAVLVFIQDTNQNVFGALVSCSLHVSELFYGTGESFLFTFHPQFEVFPWTGENTFFIKGNNESLYIGGGDGNFGLWLDGDLYQGRTQPCKTYNNPPLTDTEDFIIKTIECWCFE
ncbi:oxidation resistance protein 1 isoform X9 [Palaemon carinicauda]|uniref:oxidation resistance protein 1 isoform X9 n=1 Tax=Palaemon carinicauda TaxID=392227 RepID=UPI0035B59504